MRLVKTLIPVCIDPMHKINKHIFFEIGDEVRPLNAPVDIVVINIRIFYIDVAYRNGFKAVQNGQNEPEQVPIIMAKPYIVDVRNEQVIYKRSTFKANFNDLEPSQYAETFINQVDMVTDKWEKTEQGLEGGWTGQEIQRTRYYDLKGAQMAVVTQEEFDNLLKEFEFNGLDE